MTTRIMTIVLLTLLTAATLAASDGSPDAAATTILAAARAQSDVGAANASPEPESTQALERAVDHVRSVLDARANRSLDTATRERLRTLRADEFERSDQLLDYGLTVKLLRVQHLGDATDIWIETETSSLLDIDGVREYAFLQDYRILIVRDGVVVADQPLDIEVGRVLTPITETVVRSLPGDPYARPEESGRARIRAEDVPSPTKLKDYASSWCRSVNTLEYPDYGRDTTVQGGDCTNFASQCLRAGKLPFVDNARSPNRRTWAQYWWYGPFNKKTKTAEHSLSWSTVEGLKRHLAESRNSYVHSKWEDAHEGDIIFIDYDLDGRWNHTMVITAARKRLFGFDLRVSAHTANMCNEDFYAIAKNRWNNKAWIAVTHIP